MWYKEISWLIIYLPLRIIVLEIALKFFVYFHIPVSDLSVYIFLYISVPLLIFSSVVINSNILFLCKKTNRHINTNMQVIFSKLFIFILFIYITKKITILYHSLY